LSARTLFIAEVDAMSLLLLALLLCAPAQKGPRYVISGEVRGSDGKPAAAVTIMTEAIDFNPSQARPQSHRTLSDAHGKFAVRVDGPAKYRLIYRDEEHSYMPQFFLSFATRVIRHLKSS